MRDYAKIPLHFSVYSIYYKERKINARITRVYGQNADKKGADAFLENQSFYLTDLYESNICEDSVPLQLNCTGYAKIARPFVTDSVRRDWYLQLVDTGVLETCCGILQPGYFVVYAPQTPYRYTPAAPETLGYYWAHFTGAGVLALLENCGISPNTVYTIDEERMAVLRREFSGLFRECMLRRGGYRTIAAAMTATLLVRLGRATDTADHENVLRKRLERSVTQIHSHYTEPLGVADLARLEHLSESRFRELFRAAFGASPGEYIIDLRMAHAVELLNNTDLTIAEIAESCGYADALYFCRLFSRKQGIPPARYRKRSRTASVHSETMKQTEEEP